MLDTLFFFGYILVWVLIGLFLTNSRVKSKKEGHASFFFIVNLVLFGIGAYLWFYEIAIDGVSQVMGALLYGIFAIILTIIEVLYAKKKTDAE